MNRFAKQLISGAAIGIAGSLALRAALRYSRRMDLRNRVVVITGGSRGLGLVIARHFAMEGARLAICARDEDELDRAKHDLREFNASVLTRRCDLNNPEEIDQFIEDVRREVGPVDVLVNNAGIISVGPIETMTRKDFHDAMTAHFWGPLRMIEKVLPEMRKRRAGRIINITSIGGRIGVPHLVPYCASKFAFVGLSQGLRAELARDNIYVTTVCPGLMRTGSPRNAFFKGQHRAEYAWFSISDSLPGATVSAEHAARQIVDACRHGDAELVISIPAKLAVLAQAIAPELLADIMSITHALLPGPGGVGTEAKKGSHSYSKFSPSILTVLTERAALRNNEISRAERM